MNCYLATSNLHKLSEIMDILKDYPESNLVLQTAQAVGGMPAVDETASDFAGNALLKAEALVKQVQPGEYVLADDSGIEVAALNGLPGVRTARYAGENATDAENNHKLLKELGKIPNADRRARFVCCFVLCAALADGTLRHAVYTGVCQGRIAFEERGEHGFGYDPLFIPDGYEQTMAELGESVKRRISHRALAVKEWMGSLEKTP